MSFTVVLTVAFALVIALGALLRLVLPLERSVRVRNAFLLRRGRPEDFAWSPSAVPAGFRVEQAPPPAEIAQAVTASGVADIADDWERARALTGMLVRHSRYEGGIQADLASTYRGIVQGHGYCADFVRVFLAAARSANLFCRQWAFSFDGFGGHGHTFVEVYDRRRGAWCYLDVHNNVFATVGAAQAPADALAVHAALREAPASIAFHQAGEGRLGFPVPGKLLAYYLRGADNWYLWWGNDVVTRERRGALGVLGRVSGRLAHRMGSAFLALPSIVVLASPANEAAIVGTERLRRQVIATGAVVAALAIGLCVATTWHLVAQRGR